jgi:very-short-patch-repair endonuclease
MEDTVLSVAQKRRLEASHSPEAQQRRAASVKAAWKRKSKKDRQYQARGIIQHMNSLSTEERSARARKGALALHTSGIDIYTSKRNAKIGIATRRWWSRFSKKERQQMTLTIRQLASQANPSKPELIVRKFLSQNGIKHTAQKVFGPYTVDIFIPSHRLIIEVDGAYWHSHPDQIKRDQQRDKWLRHHGYKVLRIPAQDAFKRFALAKKRGV